LIDEEFRDTACELGVDVNRVGLKTAISPSNSGWQARVMLVPPEPPNARPGADYQ